VEFHRASDALIGTLDRSGAAIYFGGDKTMNITLEQIEREALALPAKERSQLVDKLWESLGDTTYPVLSEEWLAEIERRRQELLQGTVEPIAGEEVSRKAWEMARSTRS
jgi:putative addiction module component (TIGR02574 family)